MRNILFSIIVPVYNAEKYIVECISSIVQQSYENWELILVDDGSTDNSRSLCLNHSKKNNKIRYYYKDNSGQNDARIFGISKAVGNYCLFIDSDDKLKNGALQCLYNLVDESNIQCVIFGLEQEKPDRSRDYWFDKKLTLVKCKKSIYKRILSDARYNSLCRKMIRMDIIKECDLSVDSSIRNGEDLILSVNILKNIDEILFCPEILYFYRYNNNSISYRIDYYKLIEDTVYVDNYVFDFLSKQNCFSQSELHSITIPYLLRLIDIVRNASISSNNMEVRKICRTYLHSEFYNNYIKNNKYNLKELGLKTFYVFLIKKQRYNAIGKMEVIYKKFSEIFNKR